MAVLLFVLLVVLIATFGFWDTLTAILGAALLVVLAVAMAAAIAIISGVMLLRRFRQG